VSEAIQQTMPMPSDAPPGPTADRSLTLGASEIAAVAGLAPYKSPIDVWGSKRGLLPPDDPDVVDPRMVGKVLERPMLEHLYAPPRHLVLMFPGTLTHQSEPWASATPDAIARPGELMDGPKHAVEGKIVGGRQQVRWLNDEDGAEPGPPVEVVCQVQWQCWVLRSVGVPVTHGDVVALFGTQLQVFRVEYDAAFVADLATIASEWWQRHIVGGKMPVADGSASAKRVIDARWRKVERGLLPMPAEVEQVARDYVRLGATIRAAEEERDALGNQLRVAIADAQGFDGDGIRARWRSQKGRVSWERYATALGGDEAGAEAYRGADVRVLDVREVGAGKGSKGEASE